MLAALCPGRADLALFIGKNHALGVRLNLNNLTTVVQVTCMIRTWLVHTFTGKIPVFHLKVFALPGPPTQQWHACLPVFQFRSLYLSLTFSMVCRFRISLVMAALFSAFQQLWTLDVLTYLLHLIFCIFVYDFKFFYM